ncbi:MAG: RNA polymerase sigma factor [Myxococcota bacterium]
MGESRERWLAFARSRVSAGDAEDVVQAALARALDKLETLRDPERLEAWFFPILRNAIADHHAAQERNVRLNAQLQHHTPLLQPPHTTPSPAADSHVCNCGPQLMNTLTPEHREVVERIVLAGQPIAEAARHMDVTPNATRVRLHRARRLLQRQLKDHCGITTLRQAHDCACC